MTETGQENDPAELMEARHMALATKGVYASCTPTMAWNYHFGDREAFYAKRFAEVNAQRSHLEPQNVPGESRKRTAAAVGSLLLSPVLFRAS